MSEDKKPINLSPLEVLFTINNSINNIQKHLMSIKLSVPAISTIEIEDELAKIQPLLKPMVEYVKKQMENQKEVKS